VDATVRRLQSASREQADLQRQAVEQVKAELQPQREQAAALLAEAQACQKEFGPDIEALAKFDWESLAGRVPSHRLSPTYWAATELGAYLPNLIRTLKDVLEQIANLSRASIAALVPGEVRRTVRDIAATPIRAHVEDRLTVLKRMADEVRAAVDATPAQLSSRIFLGRRPAAPPSNVFESFQENA
jgi:hypothetical protein